MDLKGIVDKAAEMKRQREANVVNEKNDSPPEAALNGNLLKPTKQIIGQNAITWTWPWGDITVTGILAVKDDFQWDLKAGEYLVQLAFAATDDTESVVPDYYTLAGETSKSLGAMLLSAYQWQFMWKQFAGDYLLDWMDQGPVTIGDDGDDDGDGA